jgi:hypothetical protein
MGEESPVADPGPESANPQGVTSNPFVGMGQNPNSRPVFIDPTTGELSRDIEDPSWGEPASYGVTGGGEGSHR